MENLSTKEKMYLFGYFAFIIVLACINLHAAILLWAVTVALAWLVSGSEPRENQIQSQELKTSSPNRKLKDALKHKNKVVNL